MAVAKDTVVAICLAGTTIDVSNSDDALYPAYSFVPDPTQLLDTENHVWANYALAAYKGAHDFLAVNPAAETDISRSYPGIKVPPPPRHAARHQLLQMHAQPPRGVLLCASCAPRLHDHPGARGRPLATCVRACMYHMHVCCTHQHGCACVFMGRGPLTGGRGVWPFARLPLGGLEAFAQLHRCAGHSVDAPAASQQL